MAQQQRPRRSKTTISAQSTSIAHDLRNTLSCVRGYAQLLLSGPGERLKVDALSIIEAEASPNARDFSALPGNRPQARLVSCRHKGRTTWLLYSGRGTAPGPPI